MPLRSGRLLAPRGGNSFRLKDLVTVIEDSLHLSDPLTQVPVSFAPHPTATNLIPYQRPVGRSTPPAAVMAA